ncbi:hypothetical protein L596_014883 [Steinernema carpocapsae]|uniref:Signal transducing adapter molecule 1 n=1 Tax=Steinernema carpocapsae TaxID=34508 RepID=A0A4U5ND78_STECR|nr:hypothetical protein L596_014883 [Steinernema carpocapsae]
MPIFGETSSPFDEVVDKCTDERNSEENWTLMMHISDRVASEGPKAPKQCLLSIKKRLNNRDPHVIVLALALLDCIWCNAGSAFRLAVSSKEFCHELLAKATHSNRIVGEKTRLLVKKWVEEECKNDPSLALLESLYRDLVSEGLSFETEDPKKMKPSSELTAKEEEDLAIALANSMDDVEIQKRTTTSSFYPTASVLQAEKQKSVQREVRALYDFEAAEDNEISFVTGDIIVLTDDSDPNWWRGIGPKGSGLFPSSFVTSDLSDPKSAVTVQQNEPVHQEAAPLVIDEGVLDRCIELLQDCDPRGERPDPVELTVVEEASMAQRKLIDDKLAAVDQQHNMLAGIDMKIRNVLALYDNAVQQLQHQQQQQQQMYQQQAAQPIMYGNGPASSNAMMQPGVQYPAYPQQMPQPNGVYQAPQVMQQYQQQPQPQQQPQQQHQLYQQQVQAPQPMMYGTAVSNSMMQPGVQYPSYSQQMPPTNVLYENQQGMQYPPQQSNL